MFLDIGPIENQIQRSLYQLYSTFPKDDMCEMHRENHLCPNMLSSAQAAIKLAAQKWNDLAVSINRQCRTKTLKSPDAFGWGTDGKVKNSEEFVMQFLSEIRTKRFVILAALGAILLFRLVFSAISYGIAEAVTEHKVKSIGEQIIEVENISIR